MSIPSRWVLRSNRSCSVSFNVGLSNLVGAGFLCVTLLLLARGEALGTDYNDGGIHTISGAESELKISNSTTVNIAPGAVVTGPDAEPAAHYAIEVFDSGSTLNVTGGMIEGGHGSRAGGFGILGHNGHFDISNANVLGGDADGFSESVTGADAIYIQDFQSFSISSGNFTGGASDNGGGDALHIYAPTPKTAYISGGTFLGGIGGQESGGETGRDLRVSGSTIVELSDGQFTGYLSTFEDSSVVNLSGGQFANQGIELRDQATLNMSGGEAYITLNDDAQVTMTDGNAMGFTIFDGAFVSMSGGELSVTTVLEQQGEMTVTGGLLSTSAETFVMYDSSVLNVYGYGLTLESFGGPYWYLQGTLADGTEISEYSGTMLRFGNDTIVNLYEVPEPSSLVLAALACSIMLVVGRRSLRSRVA